MARVPSLTGRKQPDLWLWAVLGLWPCWGLLIALPPLGGPLCRILSMCTCSPHGQKSGRSLPRHLISTLTFTAQEELQGESPEPLLQSHHQVVPSIWAARLLTPHSLHHFTVLKGPNQQQNGHCYKQCTPADEFDGGARNNAQKSLFSKCLLVNDGIRLGNFFFPPLESLHMSTFKY